MFREYFTSYRTLDHL